jgi:hypothetical protein
LARDFTFAMLQQYQLSCSIGGRYNIVITTAPLNGPDDEVTFSAGFQCEFLGDSLSRGFFIFPINDAKKLAPGLVCGSLLT